MSRLKPGRTRSKLVQGLSDRGLDVIDDESALTILAQHGYHRLGGYTYPFRQLLPTSEQDPTKVKFRADGFYAGSSLTDVIRLVEYDQTLREVCARGCLDLEIRLRTSIADTLAMRHELAHTMPEHLDSSVSSERPDPRKSETKLDRWLDVCAKRKTESKESDPVRHHILEYGGNLPVWIQCEVSSFGDLPYLFDLMLESDRSRVAEEFGVRSYKRFGAWIRSMVDLRNVCMHGGRLFNRELKRDIKINTAAGTGPLLSHTFSATARSQQSEQSPGKKLYFAAAVLAYMLRSHVAPSDWPKEFRDAVLELPHIELRDFTEPLISPSSNMGFPASWTEQELWN